MLLGIAAYAVWRERWLLAQWTGGIGAVLLVLGLIQPRLLKWPSAVWWKLAMVLGYVNARVILSIAFFLVLTPMAMVWRLIGRDPLAIKKQHWPGWSPYPARYRDKDHFTRMY